MPITSAEATLIAGHISPTFQKVLDEYQFGKYPAADYERFKASFSKLTPLADDIKGAMVWKWGHWGKPNFPRHHLALIREIQSHWPRYVTSGCTGTANQTFDWWKDVLNRQTTYITVAYITHLIHYKEPLPIIDQHNFRAMNALIRAIRPNHRSKKRPSNWSDIQQLKAFMASVQKLMPNRSFAEIDRFLMMYGRNHAVR